MKTEPSVSTPSTSHRKSLTRRSARSSSGRRRARADPAPGGFGCWGLFRGIGANGSKDLQQAFEEFGHIAQRDHVGTIAQGLVRFGMGFDKNTIGAGHQGAPRQHRRELALTARTIS